MLSEHDFVEAAKRACGFWNLAPTQVDVLSHTENVVCRIKVSSDKQVVMRFHRPGYNELAELNSEVVWVQSLAVSGLPVPAALQTPAGDYYRSVDIGAVDSNEQRIVGVVDWVEGQPLGGALSNASGDVVAHYETIGSLAAKIRCHSHAWKPPQSFVRRRWDIDGLVGEDPLWGRFWEVSSLTPNQKAIFGEARKVLREGLGGLSVEPDRFGLIHSDLHLGNIMCSGDELTIIDFDDAGYGWFAHEIAVALHPGIGESWFASARQAFLDGYCSVYELALDEIESVDLFLVIRSLMIVGWLDARPELPAYDYFPIVVERAEQAAKNLLSRS